MTLAQFLPANAFAIFIVFARVGSALMVLPGFGDLYVPPRWRLLLAIFIAFLLVGVLAPVLPALPASPARLLAIVFGEIVIGLFIGTVARMLLAALETTGMVVSLQAGLSAAQVFNPALTQQSAITGSLLTVLGVLVVFLTDTHHLLLRGMVDSYALFLPGEPPAFDDLADLAARVASAGFRLGLELAAPLLVLGTIFYISMGLVSRLMPQLQVFFVIVPVQILGGVLVFALTLGAVTQGFLDRFVEGFGQIFLR